MLATLIESRAPHSRSVPAQLLSTAAHAALIAAAVAATQRAATATEEHFMEPPVHYVRPPEPAAPRPATPIVNPSRFRGFRVVTPPLTIPTVIPDIDLTQPVTVPDDYLLATGVPSGDPHGVETRPIGSDYTADEVDRPARLLPGSGIPRYPAVLRSAGIAGDVDVQFVIDTTGRAVAGTITVLSSTHQLFSEAVLKALAGARFSVAEAGGRKVRQVVRMPFVFSLQR